MIIDKLQSKELIHPPKFLRNNTVFLTQMGSQAYGVSSGDSDIDVYGIAIPPKNHAFPHLGGYVYGFGPKPNVFNVWTETHIKDPETQKEYDFQVYSIVKFFDLLLKNNPNIVNTLFVPRRCIMHSTAVSEHIRENRKEFLHKGAWHTFKGYAYSSMKKIYNKSDANSEIFRKYKLDRIYTLEEIENEINRRTSTRINQP